MHYFVKIASEKSKNAGEMIKYEKLKKLQKFFKKSINKIIRKIHPIKV